MNKEIKMMVDKMKEIKMITNKMEELLGEIETVTNLKNFYLNKYLDFGGTLEEEYYRKKFKEYRGKLVELLKEYKYLQSALDYKISY